MDITPLHSILAGTFFLLLMGLAVIGFMIYYQRKQLRIQRGIQDLRILHQKQMLINSLAVQEMVRRKISNDLHDEVGGLLSATNLSISLLSKFGDASVKDKIDHSKSLVAEALAQVRNLSRDLIPRTLERFGIAAAVEEFIQKMEEATPVSFSFDIENLEKRFDANLELTAYRVIQELTNNALKHAESSNIVIEIIRVNDVLQIIFKDDGKGFDLEKASLNMASGLGLGNIFSRLDVVDGVYKFTSEDGKGAEFDISIPLKAQ
ncbi:MAG: two-component system NarL family sensor kinase [Arcticibacterium sp.]|jgi:two-component system NarL family sensor kinase